MDKTTKFKLSLTFENNNSRNRTLYFLYYRDKGSLKCAFNLPPSPVQMLGLQHFFYSIQPISVGKKANECSHRGDFYTSIHHYTFPRYKRDYHSTECSILRENIRDLQLAYRGWYSACGSEFLPGGFAKERNNRDECDHRDCADVFIK